MHISRYLRMYGSTNDLYRRSHRPATVDKTKSIKYFFFCNGIIRSWIDPVFKVFFSYGEVAIFSAYGPVKNGCKHKQTKSYIIWYIKPLTNGRSARDRVLILLLYCIFVENSAKSNEKKKTINEMAEKCKRRIWWRRRQQWTIYTCINKTVFAFVSL